jgi:hypothetical protein
MGLIPRWLIPLVVKRFSEPTVLVRGKVDNIDLAGPLGVPDNQPDEVIQVSVKPWLEPYVKTWEIETDYHDRHWISAINPQRWWLIRTAIDHAQTPGDAYSHIKLCFPDFGDFERAPTFRLRATDSRGNIVWERTILKDR